jgi:hypothetical protein
MYEIKTEIEINATPEKVWSILANFSEYPLWNSFIQKIEGTPKLSEKLSVSIQPEKGKGMQFSPTVLVAEPNQELRWMGRLLLPKIFDGEHYFMIKKLDQDRVTFIHGERFSGFLAALMRSSMEASTKAGFVAMNQALKLRAEAAPAI